MAQANASVIADKQELLRQASEVMPGGVNSCLRNVEPRLLVARTQGAYIWDAEGNRYIDYLAAFGPPILGHCHAGVAARIRQTLDHLDLAGLGTTELEIDLAAKLVKHVPSVQKALLCNSGSEATYHAIRLARGVTGRSKLIKFQGCYHGFHDAVATNVITPAERLGGPDPLSAGSLADVQRHTIICEFNDLDSVEATFARNKDAVAAIILESIPHNIGCVL